MCQECLFRKPQIPTSLEHVTLPLKTSNDLLNLQWYLAHKFPLGMDPPLLSLTCICLRILVDWFSRMKDRSRCKFLIINPPLPSINSRPEFKKCCEHSFDRKPNSCNRSWPLAMAQIRRIEFLSRCLQLHDLLLP